MLGEIWSSSELTAEKLE